MFVKSLLKLHRYRKFDYRPRHFDETKDKFNELRVQKGLESKQSNAVQNLKRSNYRKQWHASRQITSHSGTSLRISIIALILFLISFFVLRYLKFI